ncbi:ubiquitin carboxyl-terminal hydrolase 16 isoform X1 [Hypanus sabinus]|uniref:ubiquitin carboxyl-terminal hydrolase 16 isoform X1 n=1 Tax=Hypanus sabinus TaxID=79690 RepID=UPI0028C38FE1|nr:ubiquitin carboxyl-terminal hydrolase 16 isoform X1 [Hypanus sabinus]XP_059824079.1 ubiquitin carboxyl-terminal hydrolase 16 isoform X1 [Hypanus sabinus]XP_059824080.1 ubiquitin carboxyl-terminal hydrolase 16 isoform X1 [Hypanus sabinus]XP_059824081.1 ubiquitin carboxyl-terminal hydrolase 16 isoform X1 [Hypanus sabinus]XP_059824082.1 ubiquitin carboxyl-terminal hydrolase 16 isoform X1 [Hypanus sabinus]
MGKKKERLSSAQDDEASDNHVPQCTHFHKGLNQRKVKKVFDQDWCDACDVCKAEDKTKSKCEETDETPTIWLCLKCGHKGCGRNSEGQHALKHYKGPHSDTHSVALCLDNWSTWCYLCDNAVHYEPTDQLGQLVSLVKKMVAGKSTKEATFPLSHENDNDKGRQDNETDAEKESSWEEKNQQISVKGLSNLGNTCFFNAVIQILSQTYVLNEMIRGTKMNGNTLTIITPNSSDLEPLEIHTEQLGPLSSAMHQFLLDIQHTKKSVVTPKELFTQVCKKAVRFKGFQQQDSQELLHYLLDGMRTEEIKRFGAAILKALNYPSEKREDEESRKIRKVYENEASMLNFVDQVFGGTLTNTIMCEECKMVTLVKETFLDLSLPVLDDQGDKKKFQGKGGRNTTENDENENLGRCNGNFISKDRNEISTGPSKYEQKKAKKQAKKQAKHHRQQQKSQAKTLSLEDSSVKCSLDEGQRGKLDASAEGNEDLDSNGIEAEASPESDKCDSLSTDHCLATTAKETVAVNGQEVSQENLDVEEGSKSAETEQKERHSDSHNSKDSDTSDTLESNRISEDLVSGSSEDDETITNNMNKLNLNEYVTNHDEITSNQVECESDSGTSNDRLSSIKTEQVLFLDPEKAFCTSTNGKLLSGKDCSIEACLQQFTQIENLTGANKLLCEKCTQRQYKSGMKSNANADDKWVYRNAKKQTLISSFPPILILHLKRFHQLGFNLRKINKHIHFPQVLDLTPFCAVNCKNVEGYTNILYSLYGVVEHSGTMRSGHYTAYVKVRAPRKHLSEYALSRCKVPIISAEAPRGRWFHVSDTSVKAVAESDVMNAQAYLLFYERIF